MHRSIRSILLMRMVWVCLTGFFLYISFNAEPLLQQFYALQNQKEIRLDNDPFPGSAAISPPLQIVEQNDNIITKSSLPIKWWSPEGEIEMLFVPAGDVELGSARDEAGHSSNETPKTMVHLTSGFWIAIHEVTQISFEKVMNFNPGSNSSGNPFCPVNRVSWQDCVDYCQRLTRKEQEKGYIPIDMNYRLPSEAEWEYACRAGSVTPHSILWDKGKESIPPFWTFEAILADPTLKGPFEILSSAPNPWGIYDMHGNVAEWTLDVYANYTGIELWDRIRLNGSEMGFRVVRGGDYKEMAEQARSSRREKIQVNTKSEVIGFRIVLAPAGDFQFFDLDGENQQIK